MAQIHQNTTLEMEAKTSCLFDVLQAGNNKVCLCNTWINITSSVAIHVSRYVAVEPVEFWLVYGWKIALSRKSLILLPYIDLQYREIFKIKHYNLPISTLG